LKNQNLLNKEVIEQNACDITRKAIKSLVDSIKEKKSPKIDEAILLWNALDFYEERCSLEEDVKIDESNISKLYV